jgi:UDP-N-acetylglucosamine acyltransferase
MIHESAYVDPKAELGRDVVVGPNSYVGAGVVLGDGCVLHNNVTLTGKTVCGKNNEFYPTAVIGAAPQDLKFKGGDTCVEIGDGNVFREMVTVHAGTEVAGRVTKIGSRNRFLVGSHVAHDCVIGNECILSNQVQLAGHVRLEDRVTMGGLIGVHHFTTIGTLAFVGGLTRIVADVPPFMIVEGNPSRVRGFNETGMKRWGYAAEQIEAVGEAYRILYGRQRGVVKTPFVQRLTELESRRDLNGEVRYLCEFIRQTEIEGIRGRKLESKRCDGDQDRKSFYSAESVQMESDS